MSKYTIMLLPKMTTAEMRKIILLDIDEVKERTHKFTPKIIREILKKKLKSQRRVFYRKVTSKNKTKWLISILKMKGEKYNFEAHLGCFFRDIKGFRYVDIDNDSERLDIYNSHFWQRYKERMNLDIEDNLELVKSFFTQNTGACYILTKKEIERGVYELSSQIPDGIKFGIQNLKNNSVVWNTFISHNEYKGNQHELSDNIKKRIKLKKALHHFDDKDGYYFLDKLIGQKT